MNVRVTDYCIFASEVAAFLGVNRYKTHDDVCLRLWRKHHPRVYAACKVLVDDRCNRRVPTPDETAADELERADTERARTLVTALASASHEQAPREVQCRVKRLLEDDPLVRALPPAEKRQCLATAARTCQAVQDRALRDVVADCERTRAILSTCAPVPAAQELVRSGLATPVQAERIVEDVSVRTAAMLATAIRVPTIPEGVQAAVQAAVHDDQQCVNVARTALAEVAGASMAVRERVQSAVNTAVGARLEGASLARFAARSLCPVEAGRVRGYSKRVACGAGCRLVVYGKVDGLQGLDCVVEAKQRQTRLFDRLPDRERLQLYTYLYLTGRTHGTLVETYRSTQREHHVVFDTTEWTAYLERICTGVRELHSMLCAHDDSPRIALMERCFLRGV
jgi:hypothetical protein